MSNTQHVLVVPFPAQGHVIPLLEFSQCLAKHGFRVTFVNSHYNHKRVLESLEGKNSIDEKIHLVSIPDGLEPFREEKNGNVTLIEKVSEVMSEKLEELIEEMNGREDEKICCVIADGHLGWAIELAAKMEIRGAVVWPFSAAAVALSFSIPKLMEDGIINSSGTIKKQMIQLAPNMPPMNSEELFWACTGDLTTSKILFGLIVNGIKAMKLAGFRFCNSTYELEPAAFTMVPELLPVGPLLASNRFGNSTGYFWPENLNCLKWLDQQQPNSVIYVAFGSHVALDPIQFQELALGLELCNRPFLWVVRPDLVNNANDAYPEGFQDRIAAIRGQLVGWAPQQKVLGHPAIACFLSHCGWNSTMEGVSNGVPFLCWPYLFDQFLNKSYICSIWKVGLNFERNESGIITKEEIKNKVDQVLGDENLKARCLESKEKALNSVREGGSSNRTFLNFLEWLKA